MSIIVAVAAGANAVVASDGRRFAPAAFDANGNIIQAAVIDSEICDKTFSLLDESIVGAVSGMMSFSGKSVTEHIGDIMNQSGCADTALSVVAEVIKKDMIGKIQDISPDEVLFDWRKLDLLLVGRDSAKRSGQGIARLRFIPKEGAIECEFSVLPKEDSIHFCTSGDDKAQEAAYRLLKANKTQNRTLSFLKMLATRAVQAGVKSAANHPLGSEPSCGGDLFVRCSGR
jgi:hypothetical protein